MKAMAAMASSSAAPAATFSLSFEFSTGATLTEKGFKPSDTIEKVKAKVYATDSMLKFAGKQLKDSSTLSNNNIQKKTTIQVIKLTDAPRIPLAQPRTPDPLAEPRPRTRSPTKVNFVGYDASLAYDSYFD